VSEGLPPSEGGRSSNAGGAAAQARHQDRGPERPDPPSTSGGFGPGAGLAIGAGIGAAIGVALNQVAVWLPIGIVVGLIIGMGVANRSKRP
jgi:hypothetical protein